jgi:Cu/Ag efflux pump CusA
VLHKILAFALKNRPAVLLFTCIVAVAGVWAFLGLAVEAFPDPTDTQVNVITLFPSSEPSMARPVWRGCAIFLSSGCRISR